MLTKYDSKDPARGLMGDVAWPYLPLLHRLQPTMELALNYSRPYRLNEVGIGGRAALLPHQRRDLPAVVDAVKRDV